MFFRARRGVTGLELPRFILLLVTTSLGWLIIGIGLLIGSLAWGLSSHQVAYAQGGQGFYHVFPSDGNDILLFQQDDTDNYYVMKITDYTPFVDPATILNDMRVANAFNFVASTDEVVVNFQIINGPFVPTAHPIEKVTFVDPRGLNRVTYTAATYSGNPNGYTINNWPHASLLLLAGAVCTSGALFFLVRGRRRRKLAKATELAELAAMPSPYARELGEMP